MSIRVGTWSAGKYCASREEGQRRRPVIADGGVWLKDFSKIGGGLPSWAVGMSRGSSLELASNGIEGERTTSGRMVMAANILVTVGTNMFPDAVKSHVQLVDGVKAFKAADGRSMGETCGSTKNATSGAQ
jgi:hypothetical protein